MGTSLATSEYPSMRGRGGGVSSSPIFLAGNWSCQASQKVLARNLERLEQQPVGSSFVSYSRLCREARDTMIMITTAPRPDQAVDGRRPFRAELQRRVRTEVLY